MNFYIARSDLLSLVFMICTSLNATTSVSSGGLLNLDDTWVAVGDSITEDGRAQTWVEYYLMACLKANAIHSVNAGIGGDVADGVNRRMDWDVLPSKPTLVSLMLGMNDVDRQLYQINSNEDAWRQRESRLNSYEAILGRLVERLKRQSVRVVLLTPTPFEHSSALAQPDMPGVDGALVHCAQIMDRIASEKDVSVIDVHARLAELNAEYQREHPEGTMIGPDRIHPQALGQFAIAMILLSGLEIPNPDQFLMIDSQTLQNECQGVDLSSFARKKAGLSFDASFSTLPFVVEIPDTAAAWVSRLKGGRGDIKLRIGKLPKGRYQLLADGTECGTFSSESLAEGVSLGELKEFPLTKSSKQLLAALRAKAAEIGKLRVIAWSEHAAYPEGRPATVAISEVEERLRTLQKTGSRSSPETIQKRLDVYGKWKAEEPEILGRVESLEKKACSFIGKTTVRFELRFVSL